jgi:phytoene/squalene synthetase
MRAPAELRPPERMERIWYRQVASALPWGRMAQRHWSGTPLAQRERVWQVAHAAKRLTSALLALRVVKRLLLPPPQ